MALASALAEMEAELGGVGQLAPLEASAVDRLQEEREKRGGCVGRAQESRDGTCFMNTEDTAVAAVKVSIASICL